MASCGRPHLRRRLPPTHSRYLHLQPATAAPTQRFSTGFHRPHFLLGKSHRLAIRPTPRRTSPLAPLRRNHRQIQQRHPHRPRQSRCHLRPPSQRQTVQRAANPNRTTLRNAPLADRCSPKRDRTSKPLARKNQPGSRPITPQSAEELPRFEQGVNLVNDSIGQFRPRTIHRQPQSRRLAATISRLATLAASPRKLKIPTEFNSPRLHRHRLARTRK